MILLNIIVGLLATVALFYWFASAFIDIGVFFIRCSGYSSTSAVPGVATITGLLTFSVCRYYFQIVESPLWLAGLLLPDILYQCGEIILLIRVRVLKWPDKALQQSPESMTST